MHAQTDNTLHAERSGVGRCKSHGVLLAPSFVLYHANPRHHADRWRCRLRLGERCSAAAVPCSCGKCWHRQLQRWGSSSWLGTGATADADAFTTMPPAGGAPGRHRCTPCGQHCHTSLLLPAALACRPAPRQWCCHGRVQDCCAHHRRRCGRRRGSVGLRHRQCVGRDLRSLRQANSFSCDCLGPNDAFCLSAWPTPHPHCNRRWRAGRVSLVLMGASAGCGCYPFLRVGAGHLSPLARHSWTAQWWDTAAQHLQRQSPRSLWAQSRLRIGTGHGGSEAVHRTNFCVVRRAC